MTVEIWTPPPIKDMTPAERLGNRMRNSDDHVNPHLPPDYAARVEQVRGPDIPYTLASYSGPTHGDESSCVTMCLVDGGDNVEVIARSPNKLGTWQVTARVSIPFAAFKLLLGQAASTLAAFENGGFFADRLVKTLLPIEVANLMYPRTLAEWHEDMGPKLWWTFPVGAPPYCGTPLDEDWPGFTEWKGAPDAEQPPYPAYLTHFTDIPVVKDPTP